MAILAIGLLQVALVLRDQVAVDLAAREGARAAAVAAEPGTAAAGAVDRALSAGGPTGAATRTDVDDTTVSVTVTAPVTAVPLIGAIVSGRDVVGRATMALEPP